MPRSDARPGLFVHVHAAAQQAQDIDGLHPQNNCRRYGAAQESERARVEHGSSAEGEPIESLDGFNAGHGFLTIL
jgi:hypothetical protein